MWEHLHTVCQPPALLLVGLEGVLFGLVLLLCTHQLCWMGKPADAEAEVVSASVSVAPLEKAEGRRNERAVSYALEKKKNDAVCCHVVGGPSALWERGGEEEEGGRRPVGPCGVCFFFRKKKEMRRGGGDSLQTKDWGSGN